MLFIDGICASVVVGFPISIFLFIDLINLIIELVPMGD